MVKVDFDDKVEALMRRTVYFVDKDSTVLEAARIMKIHNVGSVIVKDNEQPIGIVTERDVLYKVIAEGKDPSKIKVKHILSTPLIVAKSEERIREVISRMAIHGFRRLPVVDEKGKIVGLIAQRFIFKEEEEELKERSSLPMELSLELHDFHKGKIEIIPKVPITDPRDFSLWYTPGVASTSKAIKEEREKVFRLTNKWNTVAIVTDGSRTLGLGNVGPYSALPVMEGKALLFKYLGAVDAFPICLNTQDQEKIIEAVKFIEPSFGGINLEDIESPKCFYILERLSNELEIPVWHDDQQGTATVTIAGLINALEIVGKDKKEIMISLIGSGAANLKVADLLIKFGVKAGNMILVDSKGILNQARKDLEDNPYKMKFAKITNAEQREGGIEEALRGADVVIAFSRPGPGIIKKEWIRKMNSDAIVFAGANPIPEIWPWEAKEAGARIVATGRSDFPNQINNSLAFPAVFRGVFEVMAKKITDELCLTAAEAIAKSARKYGINEDYIIPRMEQQECYIETALAVALKAQELGLAREKKSEDELRKSISEKITRMRRMMEVLLDNEILNRKYFSLF